jgi:hypothetical protein
VESETCMLVPQAGKILKVSYRNKRNNLFKSTIIHSSLRKYIGRITPVLIVYNLKNLVRAKVELGQFCRAGLVVCCFK